MDEAILIWLMFLTAASIRIWFRLTYLGHPQFAVT
jgi:hypothetical protein